MSSEWGQDARKRLHFPPVLNGLDFLESSVELLGAQEDVPPRDLKYAVVHLAAAVETILKARLALTNPNLVWASSSDYDERKHKLGDFKSVGWEDARNRVRKHCEPKTDLPQRWHFRALADMRNRIAHVGVTEDAPTVEVLTTPMLDFLLDFVHTDLLSLVDGRESLDAQEYMDRVRPKLGRIQRLVDQRLAPARELLTEGVLTIPCRVCAALSVPIKGGHDNITCVVCHTDYGSPAEAAWIYADESAYEVVTQGGDSPVFDHDECGGAVTHVPTGGIVDETEATMLLCLFCGEMCTGVCAYCSQAVGSFALPEADMCQNCMDHKLESF